MDLGALTDLINGVGFPIAMVAYFIWDKTKVTNQLVTAINNNNIVLSKIATILGHDELTENIVSGGDSE